jgi:hypothetical protein
LVRFLRGAAAAFGLCRCSAFIIAICGIIGLPPCSPTSIRTSIGGGNFALDFRQLDDVLRGVAERHQQLAPPRQFDRIVKPVIPYAMNWTPLPLQWRLGPI